MKRLLILLIATLCLLPVAHQAYGTTHTTVKDSLLRLYHNSAPDSTRLQLLYQLSILDQTTPTCVYYLDKMLKEAEAQKNVLYQSSAMYTYMIYYYNQLDQKHVEQWLHRLETFAEKHHYYNHYFRGMKMIIELYIIHQQTEIALAKAQEMYNKAEKLGDRNGMREACLCIMTAYFNISQYTEGVKYLDKAFELLSPDASDITLTDIYTKAVLCYAILHDNEKLKLNLDAINEVRERVMRTEPEGFKGYVNVFLFIDMEYALYYTRKQQPKEALASLQEAEKNFSKDTFLPYQLIYWSNRAEYFQLVGDHEAALENIDRAIALAEPISLDDAINYGFQKAHILTSIGRYDEALAIYGKMTAQRDSLSAAFSNSQIRQIESMSNIDEMIVQKEKRRALYHRICLAIVIVVILLLIPSNYHAFKSQMRLRRDEKEVRKLAQVAEEANDMKGRFLTNMSYNIRISLNNVVGFSQLLSTDEDLSEQERNEYSAIVQSHSGQLIQLVNDVLDLSRLEANMMKYQMVECTAEEWVNEISCMVQMRSEGIITMEMTADVADARINADTGKLTQYVMNISLYPIECREPRTVKMSVKTDAETHMMTCRIENSPMADPRFASQKISVRHDIHRLFFEHFGGIYQIGEATDGAVPPITFTYPTL